MSFARQRDPGLWTFDSVVEDYEFEYFDESLSNAIDGLNGGSYSLQADLSIGGIVGSRIEFTVSDFYVANDMEVGGYFTSDGGAQLGSSDADALSVYARASFHSQVEFSDYAHFLDNVEVEGLTYLNGTTTFNDYAHFLNNAEVEGLTYLNDDLQCGGIATFIDDVIVGGILSVANEATFGGGAVFPEGATFVKRIALSGAGRVTQRIVQGSSSNASYGPATVDVVYVPSGALAADVAYTIDDTDAVNGDHISFASEEGKAITIKNPGGTTLAVLQSASGGPAFDITCHRLAGSWVVTRRSRWP